VSTPRIFPSDLLAGKVALITGGGTGIGFGIASCLARAGATVAIASRKPENLATAADALRAEGATVSTVEANVREPGRSDGWWNGSPGSRDGSICW
jgi:citronellol/citronellal dehydrogenase